MKIGAQLSGMEQQLLLQLWEANLAAQDNALRLVSGKKVDRPADDPSAFIQVSGMQTELSDVNNAIARIDGATNVAAQAQLAVDQMRTQLNTIRSALLADENGTLSDTERTEKQSEIDAALAAIDDLARTEVNGRRILDGSADHTLSGRNSSQVRDLDIYAVGSVDPTIAGTVTQAAQQATLEYAGSGKKVRNDATFALSGKRGITTITVAKNESLSDVADRINAESHGTGITASVAGNTLTLTTVDYGSAATIAVDVTSGTFNVTGGNGDGTANGTDAELTINGLAVSAEQISGNTVNYARNGYRFRLELAAGFSGDLDTITIRDDATLKFALSPSPESITTVALPSLFAARFGGVSGRLTDLADGGSLAGLADNTSQAIRVVDEALSQLTLIEARVDSFANTTVASSAAVTVGFAEILDNNGDGVVDVNEIDEEKESLLLTKNQSMAANALASLAIVQQQQQSILILLHQQAGLA